MLETLITLGYKEELAIYRLSYFLSFKPNEI